MRGIADDSTSLSIDDDNIYSKKGNRFYGAKGGYSYDHQYSNDREHYYSGQNVLDTHAFFSGNSKNAIASVNNLVFIYEKHAGMVGGGEGYTFDIDDEDFLYSKELMLVNKHKAIMSEWDQTKYKTNINSRSRATFGWLFAMYEPHWKHCGSNKSEVRGVAI